MESLRKRFVERVQSAMAANGWSQSELAREMGITRAMVSQYLSGHRSPGLEVVQHFADALRLVNPWNLLDDKPLLFADPPPSYREGAIITLEQLETNFAELAGAVDRDSDPITAGIEGNTAFCFEALREYLQHLPTDHPASSESLCAKHLTRRGVNATV